MDESRWHPFSICYSWTARRWHPAPSVFIRYEVKSRCPPRSASRMPKQPAKPTIAGGDHLALGLRPSARLLHDLSKHPSVNLRPITLGPHLTPEFGYTGKEVASQFRTTMVECLFSSDTDVGMAKTPGVATLGLAAGEEI